MRVVLSNTAGTPIYEQIKEQIKAAILGGELHEGDLLPSIRSLAKDLRISVITTTRAYTDLAAEGFVVNVQGKGCYVLAPDNDLAREQLLRQVEDGLEQAVHYGRLAGLDRADLVAMLDQAAENRTGPDRAGLDRTAEPNPTEPSPTDPNPATENLAGPTPAAEPNQERGRS